jgi:hypothetical protein
MAQNLSSVTLKAPVSDPDIQVSGSFDMTITATLQGGGPVNPFDLTWEWDQGSSNWTTIGTSSSSGLYHSGTNPQTGLEAGGDYTLVIYGGDAGQYIYSR